MKIGLLVGREESFPQAFIERISALKMDGLTAELVEMAGTRHDELARYDVIIDRISHDVPYYRMALKQAALAGTRVINNPFWTTADDKFFGYALAAKIGLDVPRTVLLPNKDYSPDVSQETLRNLKYPLDWQGIADWVGLPAFIKPATGGGWRDVNQVHSMEELLYRYDQSGEKAMVLQQAIDFDKYVRCFCFGGSEVIVTRYDVENRCYLPLDDYLSAELEARIIADCKTINQALGYDVNTVEFAVADDVPYAIDFTNFAPDMELWSITPHYFDRVVDAMVALVLETGSLAQQSVPSPSSAALVATSLATATLMAGPKPVTTSKRAKAAKKPAAAKQPKATKQPAAAKTAKKSAPKSPAAKQVAKTSKKTATKKTATKKTTAKKATPKKNASRSNEAAG